MVFWPQTVYIPGLLLIFGYQGTRMVFTEESEEHKTSLAGLLYGKALTNVLMNIAKDDVLYDLFKSGILISCTLCTGHIWLIFKIKHILIKVMYNLEENLARIHLPNLHFKWSQATWQSDMQSPGACEK